MAELTLTVSNRAITFPQNVPQQITNTEYIDKVKFNCDAEYTGYSLVALFKNGERGKVYPVAVPADRSAVDIDPRALRRKGYLYIGMYGLNGLKVLPTLWSTPIEIKEGVDTSATEDPEAPVPSIYAALVARVDALETAVDDLEDDVDGLDVAVEELDEAVDQLDADVDALETTVAGKQDVIADLDTIRSGAAAGATALQSVPIATPDTVGGGKFSNSLGLYVMTSGAYNGQVRTYPANDSDITGRSNNYRPITPANMDTAFRTCITDPAQELTDNQKAAACATIGAEYKGNDNWENVAQLDATQTQFIIDLTGYTEICIESHLRASQNVNLRVNNNMILFSNIAINGSRSVYAEWKDNKFGFCSSYAMRSSGYDIVTDALSCENQCYGGTFNISGINKFYLDATITAGSIVIYAR